MITAAHQQRLPSAVVSSSSSLTMDTSKSTQSPKVTGDASSSLALARHLLANSQSHQQSSTMLQFPQQGAFALGAGNVPPQVGQQVDFNSFLNGFMPGAQAMMGNPAWGMTFPGTTFAALGARGPQLFAHPQMNAQNSQDVQDALAKIAAASFGGSTAAGGAQLSTALAEKKTAASTKPSGDGQSPVLVYMECDEESLSDYQCLLRKQIELFEATSDDVQWNAQGRNKAIVLGQVGIRCRYCARLPTWSRARGAVYYSATLDGLYQAAQNMAKNHLCRHCRLISEDVRQKLIGLRDCKRRAAGGKKYWAEGARVLGVEQCSDGLRFKASKTGRTKPSQDEKPSSL